MNPVAEALFDYARDVYGIESDYPFPNDPDIPVLRHPDTRKWFAIVMNVPRSALKPNSEGRVDIMNVKCDPILSGSLRLREGYYPAYHMNHDLWLTVLLDGSVPFEEITPLLDLSYELTRKKHNTK